MTRESIGDRIAAARRLLKWDQAELAEAMQRESGDETWDRWKISKVERGAKIVPAEELAMFASIEGQPIWWYYGTDPYNLPANAAAVASGANPRSINQAPDRVVIPIDQAPSRRKMGHPAHSPLPANGPS